MSNCKNRYYMKKARIHDSISPKTFLTLNDCLDIMNKQDQKIGELNSNEYHLLEEINQYDNDLNYLKEAIQSVKAEYKLKQHINDHHLKIKSKFYLECIQDIHKQLELIQLREEGGTLWDMITHLMKMTTA